MPHPFRLLALLAAVVLLLLACTAFEPPATPTAAPTSAVLPPPTVATAIVAPTGAAPEPTPTSATTLPETAGFTWELLTTDFNRPVAIAHAGDGSGRLFIAEKGGRIRIWQAGQALAEPFLDIRDRTDGSGYEQGLLGLAFHPQYAANGLFFINYTDRNGDTVVARYRVTADDPNRADPASATTILNVRQPYPNHNGGHLAFGPDGYLYIGLGDGGLANDPAERAQNPNELLGKMLRLDVDQGDLYSIPPDNPYASGGGRAEIWALGLRNPWRYAFDTLTGDLYIADVGQNAYEEVNFLPAGSPPGANFGWDYREGLHPFEGQPPAGLELIDPVAEYGREGGCSITGGEVYRGTALPEFYGVYLYADHCSGRVWGLLLVDGAWQNELLFGLPAQISSFGIDEAGEVYFVDLSGGGLYRLTRR